MQKLICDICGGNIVVQSGGQYGVCEYCGANYTLDRMREIVSGVKVSQTGSAEDVEQWKELVKKYYSSGSYNDAENIVKKILEASPIDPQANQWYDELQGLKYFDIRNGVAVDYTGLASKIIVPPVIKELNMGIFSKNYYLEELVISEGIEKIYGYGNSLRKLKKVTLPSTLKEIGSHAFDNSSIEEIIIPNNVTIIGINAFLSCYNLEKVILPKTLNHIGYGAFAQCKSLNNLELPLTLKSIDDSAFAGCSKLEELIIPTGIEKIPKNAFSNCNNLRKLVIPDSVKTIDFGDMYYLAPDGEKYDIRNHYKAKNWILKYSTFENCDNLSEIIHPPRFERKSFIGTPYSTGSLGKKQKEREQKKRQLISQGNCPDCGGNLSVFNKCKNCGKHW